ncbi:hypothetical protein LP419_38920 [Massilia sp. H-1]|nr:hypothetical protein LP419_38920 [Massilia sp. H-1]
MNQRFVARLAVCLLAAALLLLKPRPPVHASFSCRPHNPDKPSPSEGAKPMA